MAHAEVTSRGSMIVPVPFALFEPLPEQIVVGGTPLVRKAELHMTVFNYALGKLLLKAFKSQPRLLPAINQEAATFDWKVRPRDQFVHLVNTTPGRPELQTVVQLVDSAVSSFYHATRELVGEDAAEEPTLTELMDALRKPPPPHVTLFTSDPQGVAGIGLNTVAELDAALALAQAPGGPPGLRAIAIPRP